MNRPVYIVVAADKSNGIGKDGGLPWHLKDDLRHFKEVTTKTSDPNKQNLVIMGRTTWESIPENHRPLTGRRNIVLSRNPEYRTEGAQICDTLRHAFELADENIETIYIIGGGNVYHQIINNPELTGVYLTRVHGEFHCDTFFPDIPPRLSHKESLGSVTEGDITYDYLLYDVSDLQDN